MYKRWTQGKLLLIFTLSLVGGFFFGDSAFAAGEGYVWQSPTSINGRAGNYPTSSNFEMGDQPGVFTYVAEDKDCEATLTLTVSPTSESEATLTSDGKKCDYFAGLEKNIRGIENAQAQRDKVAEEQLSLTTTYLGDECGANALENLRTNSNTPEETQCLEEKRRTVEGFANECKSQFNYEQNVMYGEPFLNCFAEKLGIDRDTTNNEKPAGQASKCTIPGIGWVVCWTTYYLAQLTDFTFDLLTGLLEIEPLKEQISTGGESTVYGAWQSLRNLANIAFVVVFMIVIVSQVTGYGIGSYGIKKIAPRLIVAALLVNISFYICGVAVDLSNIAGKNIQSFMISISTPKAEGSDACSTWQSLTSKIISITPDDKDAFCSNADQQALLEEQEAQAAAEANGGNTTDEVVNYTLGGLEITGMALLYANLAALVPLMLAALLAMVITIIILILRQALIIMLVILSPLAFVAYLLPNTNSLFDKWRKTFVSLLMLYPLVSLIFGASFFASKLIYETARQDGDTFLAIFSLGIMMVPLFITPLILKFGGRTVNQFTGVIKGAASKPYGALQSKAQGFRDGRKQLQQTRALTTGNPFDKTASKGTRARRAFNLVNPYGYAQRAASRGRATEDLAKRNLEDAKKEFLSGSDTAREVAEYATKGISDEKQREEQIDQLTALAKNEEFEARVKRMDVALARIEQVGFDGKNDKGVEGGTATAMKQIALTGKDMNGKQVSEATQLAAIKKMASTGSVGMAHELINASSSMSNDARKVLAAELRKSGVNKKAPHLGGAALGMVEQGSVGHVSELVTGAANGGKFSQDAMSNMDDAAANELLHVVNRTGITNSAMRERLQGDVAKVLDTPELARNLSPKTRAIMERLR